MPALKQNPSPVQRQGRPQWQYPPVEKLEREIPLLMDEVQVLAGELMRMTINDESLSSVQKVLRTKQAELTRLKETLILAKEESKIRLNISEKLERFQRQALDLSQKAMAFRIFKNSSNLDDYAMLLSTFQMKLNEIIQWKKTENMTVEAIKIYENELLENWVNNNINSLTQRAEVLNEKLMNPNLETQTKRSFKTELEGIVEQLAQLAKYKLEL
jgi:hypothetical protein